MFSNFRLRYVKTLAAARVNLFFLQFIRMDDDDLNSNGTT